MSPVGRPRRIVAVGGGTGLSALLRGLKLEARSGDVLTGIVTVADDGGSSGRLRRELGTPPPGDVRSCLVALADDEDLLSRLFQYRFADGNGLSGHSFGNLFLAALTDITGDFSHAILTAESILSVRGKILPSTLDDVRLVATGASGRRYEGESAIGASGEPIATLGLEPAGAAAFPAAVEAIAAADLVVLGPGSLYTSILPNLLFPAIREAVATARAPVVLVLNLMTQPGETDAMGALEHLEAFSRHLGAALVERVLANATRPSPRSLETYAATGAEPVAVAREAIRARGVEVLERDLLADDGLIRHDPRKLARAVLSLVPAPVAARRRADSRSPA